MIFRLTRSITRNAEVVEIWDDGGHLMATMYPVDDTGIRIMSRHLEGVTSLEDTGDGVGAVSVSFKSRA